MAKKLSPDDRASISIGLIAAAFLALLFSIHYLHWPDLHLIEEDRPVWRNLYLWSSSIHSSDYASLYLFVTIANGVNNAKGQPPRPWLASLVWLAGVSAILTATTLESVILPHVGILDSLLAATVGLTVAVFFAEGVPTQVWRNLIARSNDYAGRFFPLVGTLVCLILLGGWVWWLDRRWMTHDYTSCTDVACFAIGVIAGLVGGKRRLKSAVSAAIA